MKRRLLLRIVGSSLGPEASRVVERIVRSSWDVDYVVGSIVVYLIVYYDRGRSCRPIMVTREGSWIQLEYLAIATLRGVSRGIRVSECIRGKPYWYNVSYGLWDLCEKPGYTGTVFTRDFKLCVSGRVKPVRIPGA